MQLRLLCWVLLTITTTIAFPSILSTSSAMTFCKCICFSNSTILPLYLPKDPLYPCLTCTKQFCLDQKLPSCINAKSGEEDLDTGTGVDGDVEARCFQRDSPKSHLLVVLFLILTCGLLIAAVLKQNGLELSLNGISQQVGNIVRTRLNRGRSRM